MDLSALMQSVKEGDREALAKLCSLYQTELYNDAIKRTDNADEARAVVKAVFKEMYHTIRDKGPYTGDFSAWLHQLADKELRALWHNRIQSALEKPAFSTMELEQPAQADAQPKPESPPSPVRTVTSSKQYTPEEVRELEARADARLSLGDIDDDDEDDYNEKSGLFSFAALIGLSALLVWMLIGFLSSLGMMPEINLGYKWFNETFFRLF